MGLHRPLRHPFAHHSEYADLHGSCFYESRCPAPDVLGAKAQDARTFVEDVKAAFREVRRRGAGEP